MRRALLRYALGGIALAALFFAAAICPGSCHAAADEIHWTIMGQTAVTFDWRAAPGSDTLYYATRAESLVAGAAGPLTRAAKSIGAVPLPAPWSSDSTKFREAPLTSLTENTVYSYRIGATGQVHTFTTPIPRGSSEFVICAQGDIGDTSHYSQIAGVQSLILSQSPAFVLCDGDLTYANDHGPSYCDTHFNNVMKWSQDAAYMPAWGNHEWDKSPTGCTTVYADDMRNYKGRFGLPNAKESSNAAITGGSSSWNGGGEDWYWFDYGNVRFIAIPDPYSGSTSSCSSNSAVWTEWKPRADSIMTQVDNDPQIKFIVTFGHRPSYCTGHHPGESSLALLLNALGDSHPKYLLDLSGHSHNYERTYPQHGVTHIVSGLGGGTYEGYSTSAASFDAVRFSRYGPLKLTFHAGSIDGAQLCGPSGSSGYDVTCGPTPGAGDGSAIDSFTINASGCACPIPNGHQ